MKKYESRRYNSFWKGIIVLFILAFSVGAGFALDKDDLIFYVSFDKGFDADVAKGNPAAKAEGAVKLVPNGEDENLVGRNGTRAAKFTSKGDLLRYSLDGNVHLPQGAVSLWVYELDTKTDQRVWNPYFQIAGKEEVFNVLRLWQPINVAGGLWRPGQKVAFAGGGVGKLKEWHHVLFTWRKHEISIYVNGKLSNTVTSVDFLLLDPPDTFTLGRPANPTYMADDFHTGEHLLKDAPEKAAEMKIGKESYGAYLLDDVAIFNRYLGVEEAEVIFKRPLAEALNAGAKGRHTLKLLNYPSSARVRVDADFGRRLPKGARITARALKEDGSPAGLAAPLKMTRGGLEYGYLDVKKLAPGKYGVIVVATKAGKVIAQTPKADFERTEPEEWMTNTYGKEDIVIQGFKPLKAEGTTIKLWGRTYDFGNAIMPTQITNQGKKMLARPINWSARIGGKDCSLVVGTMKLTSSSETRATYEGKGTIGGISVAADVMVEYDGFMKFEIIFDAGAKPLAVEKLWMDIPLVPAQSTNLFHPTRRSGAWKNDWESELKLCYTNVITLGTPDISLQWLTESDQYYFPRGNKQAVQTLEKKGERIFRDNVIGANKTIDKPFTLTFALHAGPVRPRPANWRGWTMTGRKYLDPKRHTSVAYRYFQGWWSRTPGSLIPRQGFPEKRDPNMLKDIIDGTSTHFAGFRRFDAKDVKERLPEWEKYESEWERIPDTGFLAMGTAPGWNNTFVDPNSSWRQWHVYNCYKLFKLTGMRGLYYDDWVQPLSMNEAAGSGYIDENGIRRPVHPIFSQREIHKRVYSIIKRFRPDDGIVIIHTASSIFLPIVSFCDIIYDGEIMGWVDLVPPEGNYFETFRNDLFQMIFSCKNYGPVGGFHDMTAYYLGKEGRFGTMASQRKLWAKLLMHDIHAIDGLSTGWHELLIYWLDSFDIADPQVKFHSYWQPNPAVKVLKGYWSHGDDRASKMWAVAYSKPGKVLVVVVRDAPNNYSGEITVDVQLDRKQLGLPADPLKSFDLETLSRTEKGVVEGDILKVHVNVDDFSAVVISPK